MTRTVKQVFEVTVNFTNTDFGEVERTVTREFFDFEAAAGFVESVRTQRNNTVNSSRVQVSVRETV